MQTTNDVLRDSFDLSLAGTETVCELGVRQSNLDCSGFDEENLSAILRGSPDYALKKSALE